MLKVIQHFNRDLREIRRAYLSDIMRGIGGAAVVITIAFCICTAFGG